ncbi:hypothetical protein [Blastococcus atacamensis]|uniref:hypothetical protein n=1 Tax=Blastococcus atacamensis TaxID=2070508 RepID=UPI0012FFE60C|nr:hypothetical protein [Blastococcus atacamensis]
MVRWGCAAVVGLVLTGFAFLLITGEYVNDGPVVATVAQNRGLHVGDVFLLLGWLAALAALAVLTAAAGRRRER